MPAKLAKDFDKLGLYSTAEHMEALCAALQEISPNHYSGRRPPDKSYEPGVKGDDLFAFSWASKHFGKSMYVKFCLHKFDEQKWALFVFSLHEDNPEKRTRR